MKKELYEFNYKIAYGPNISDTLKYLIYRNCESMYTDGKTSIFDLLEVIYFLEEEDISNEVLKQINKEGIDYIEF